jgi:glycosyltransferase involved in cell wall biosynthesis
METALSRRYDAEGERGLVSFRRLVINGKYLGAGPTGVHRVADQLIDQLACRQHELASLFGEAPRLIAPTNVVNVKPGLEVERRGFFRGQLWEQLDLPRLTTSDLLLSLCNLAPMASVAAITMIHDAQVFISPESYSRRFAAWYRWVLPVLGHRHLRILAVSNFTARELVRFKVAPADRISVIPNGVDHVLSYTAQTDILRRLQLGQRSYVVGLANVQPHKNIGLLLSAFSDPALGHLKLVLVGGDDRSRFATIGHSVSSNVVFAGRVTDGELRALLERALCVAFPSTTEGFGLPPLEGMLLGCPAVMAPCGALPEIGGDAALFAPSDDPRQWASAIGKLASDPTLWQQYSHAGRERAKLFTWSRAGEELMNVIRTVVSTRSAVSTSSAA